MYKALADLGANISLMPYSMYARLDLGELKPTRTCIELANKSTQYPRGIAENVIVKVDKFIFHMDFVVLDMKERHKILIILGRPFIATAHAMIDVFNKKISFKVGNETITFDIEKSMKFSTPEDDECLFVDLIDNVVLDLVKEILPPKKESLSKVLTQHKAVLAWKFADIKGISPSFCTHKILMEDNFKPVVQPQRRLNPKVQDVVKAEIVKLLDSGLIYAIFDSPWVSPIHVVPKGGGVTVITNENNELVSTRIVTGWRVCIDYRKLNDATRKDHFPLPFIDQMLERLSGNEYYCFLDGFSGLCNAPTTFQRCMMAIFHDMCKDFMEVFMDDFSVFGNSFDSCLTNLSKMLARLENPDLETLNEEAIQDSFPDEYLMAVRVNEAVEDP
ncbi:DNA-directed DNA polymerase, partial [Tanacetum coccineum]